MIVDKVEVLLGAAKVAHGMIGLRFDMYSQLIVLLYGRIWYV